MARTALWFVTLVLCLVAVAQVTLRVGERTGSIEIGRALRLAPDPALVAAIDAHSSPVLATLYVSEREALPTALRGLESELTELFGRLEDATEGRFGWTLVHPGADQDARTFATARGVAERRVRLVRRDGWSETSVFATVELTGANGRTVLLEGLVPDDLDQLQRRIEAHLELFERPTRPRIALCAPESGYGLVRAQLSQLGDLVEFSAFEASATADALATADLFVWLEPDATQLAAGALERVESLLARGASVIVTAGAREERFETGAGAPDTTPSVVTSRRPVDLAPLWSAFALEEIDALLFDELSVEVLVPDRDVPLRVPFAVRSIAPNQDFRRYAGQPNATLVLASPAALALDEARLTELGWRAHVLATSSDRSFAPGPDQDLASGVSADDLTRANGLALPKLPLLVELEPDDTARGRAVVCAAPRFLHDEFMAGEGGTQARALRLVVDGLTATDRLVAARGRFTAPPRFESPTRSVELGWRALALGLPAALLVAVALLRRRTAGVRPAAARGLGRSRAARPFGRAAAVLAAVLLVLGPLVSLLLGGAAVLPTQLVAIARDAAANGRDVRIEFVLPAAHRLPADLRAATRAALAHVNELESAVPGLEFDRIDPDTLEPTERARLPLPERTVVREVDGVRTARRLRLGLIVTVGDRTEAIEFEDARAFEVLDFRLAHALWRATTGERSTVAVASTTPRLSSAEAHLEFQQLQLFAPTGSDVFSAARERLARDGFDVAHLDADAPRLPLDTDALVWLQPRRSIVAVLDVLANHVHGGGSAFVAGQAHELVARQLEGRDLELVHWPRPTNDDLDALWFADIGASVASDLVFDALVFDDRADVRTESDARGRSTAQQDSALPFQVRVSAASHAPGSMLDGLRDLPWYGGGALVLDEAQLTERGLRARVLVTTSTAAWTYNWQGGYLTPDVLEGRGDGVLRDGARALVAEITGTFPAVDEEGHALAGDAPTAPATAPVREGRLVLASSSALFANGRLFDERFGTRELLTSIVADLALPRDLATLARGSERHASIGLVEPDARLRWRGLALVAAPLLALLLGLARRLATVQQRRRREEQR